MLLPPLMPDMLALGHPKKWSSLEQKITPTQCQFPFIRVFNSNISRQMVIQIPLLWPAHTRTLSSRIRVTVEKQLQVKKIITVFRAVRASLRRKSFLGGILGKCWQIYTTTLIFRLANLISSTRMATGRASPRIKTSRILLGGSLALPIWRLRCIFQKGCS